MRICFIGPANSAHIVKWCRWFVEKGHEVHVISFTPGEIEKVEVHLVDVKVNPDGGDFQKLKYLLTGRKIKKLVKSIQPDVINVHYATSYGVAVALGGLKHYILSVWGSDIYDFPKKSFFHRTMLKYSLKKAEVLFSTSQVMADEASKYTKKKFSITPFGVDTELFSPDKCTRLTRDDAIVVGTVKGLSDKYGIRNILEAVAILRKQGKYDIRLRIAGRGPQEQEYKELARTLGLDCITTWLGFINQEEAAEEWANMDIALIPSTLDSESFGVSAVEAQAAGTAVIISDVPGLMEATKPGVTSVVVQRNDSAGLADAIEALINDPEKRAQMGRNGTEYVRKQYELNRCFEKILCLYKNSMSRGSLS